MTETVETKKPLSVERRVDTGFPEAEKFPNIRGGVCDFCGIVNKSTLSRLQYTECEHYKGLELKCSYCPPGTDFEDVIEHRMFSVFEYPKGSGSLTICCDDIRCRDSHHKRFNKGRTI